MVERISALIKQNGLSLNAVEKQLGFGNGAIKRFDTNSPSIDKISSLDKKKLRKIKNQQLLRLLVLQTDNSEKLNYHRKN